MGGVIDITASELYIWWSPPQLRMLSHTYVVRFTCTLRAYYNAGAGRTRVVSLARLFSEFPPESLSSETSTSARGWLSGQQAVRATAS